MKGFQVSLNNRKIKHEADKLEPQLRLVLHGFPLELVDHATADQLAVMNEILNRDLEDQLKLVTIAINNGIATAFGAKDK